MSEWRDIETAPKDNRNVLVFVPDDIGVVVGYYLGKWVALCSNWEIAPTHWMPLPAPPVESKSEVGG